MAFYKGYLAVWRTGSGSQHWLSGFHGRSVKQVDTSFFNIGLRLMIVDLYYHKDTISAVWGPGSGVQFWATGSPGASSRTWTWAISTMVFD